MKTHPKTPNRPPQKNTKPEKTVPLNPINLQDTSKKHIPPIENTHTIPANHYPSRNQAARELARRSLIHFARLIQPRLHQEKFHQTYYQILEAFARGKIQRLVITMPPQHGKSTGSSVLLPAYLLGINPTLHIALASYSLSLAARFNRHIQQLIDTPLYRRIFPATQIKSTGRKNHGSIRNQTEFGLLGQPGSLLAVGREGALTGNPVDVLILDDLYKDAMEANSPLIRDNIWAWYNSVVKTRMHNRSQELIVSTRWHEDDLIGRLSRCQKFIPLTEYPEKQQLESTENTELETWFHLHFEALKNSQPTQLDPRHEGEALWPDRQSETLLNQKRRLDPAWFETLYQGNPVPAEGRLYGEEFQTYDTLPETIIKRGNYTDTADTGTDYLCSVCYAVDTTGIIYVTGVTYSGEPMENTEPMVVDLLKENDTRIARIESNNGGRGFARAIARQLPNVRIEWFHQARNKEARILSHSATVLQMLRMPKNWARKWGQFHDDLITYRRLYRANKRHDAPDVLTGIIETEITNPSAKKIRAVGFASLSSNENQNPQE